MLRDARAAPVSQPHSARLRAPRHGLNTSFTAISARVLEISASTQFLPPAAIPLRFDIDGDIQRPSPLSPTYHDFFSAASAEYHAEMMPMMIFATMLITRQRSAQTVCLYLPPRFQLVRSSSRMLRCFYFIYTPCRAALPPTRRRHYATPPISN